MNRDLDTTPRASTPVRFVGILAIIVQVGLFLAAVTSIARRRKDAINGPKWMWLLISCINFVGPIAYLLGGRKLTK